MSHWKIVERRLWYIGGARFSAEVLPLLRDGFKDRAPILVEADEGAESQLLADLLARLQPGSNGVQVTVRFDALSKLPASLVHEELFVREDEDDLDDEGVEPRAFEEDEFFGELPAPSNRAERPARSPGSVGAAAGGTLLLERVEHLGEELSKSLVSAWEARPRNTQWVATHARSARDHVLVSNLRSLGAKTLAIPALGERKDDLVSLFELSLKRAQRERELAKALRITKAARTAITSYPWPGHHKEMLKMAEKALVFCEGEIEPSILPQVRRG